MQGINTKMLNSNDIVPAKATPNLLHVQGLRASVGKFPPMASDRDAKCSSVWCTAGVHQLKIQSNDVRTLCPMEQWKDRKFWDTHARIITLCGKKQLF